MNFKLVTLLGEKVNEAVYSVVIPTIQGEITVYPGHEPLVTLAVDGVIIVRYKKGDPDNVQEYYAISGGVVEVSPKGIKVLVDEADHGDEIVEADSRAALERALELRDTAGDQIEREKAHQLIDRHRVRLKVAELRRRHRR